MDAGGNISVDDSVVARLKLVRFDNPERLVPEGDSLLAASPEAALLDVDPEETRLIPESIELSNVDAIRGLLELIDVTRGYEAYMRAMRQVDGTVQTAIREVGGTT